MCRGAVEVGGAPAKLKDGAGDAVRTSSLFVPAPTLNAKPTAKTMKDGATLCADFQKGTCSPCSNGAHRCAVVLRGKRRCQMQG